MIHLFLPRMQCIDQAGGDHGWQAASVPEAGHRGGRGPPGSEKTRFNQMEASAGGEPTLGNAFCRRGIKGEDESGEPELHLSGLKSWLN